jgi:hypothetical protein
MGQCCTPFCWKISFLLFVFSLGSRIAGAQIMSLSPAEIKAQTRKNQKEAARYEAEHKETHLETHHFNHKKGQAGRRQVPVLEEPAEYVYDKEINAIYEEPREAAAKPRSRKSKKEKSKAY